MSALGVGIFLGSFPAMLVASMSFARRSGDALGVTVTLLFVGGIVAMLLVNPLLGGFVDFIIGAALLPLGVYLLTFKAFHQTLRKNEERRLEHLAVQQQKESAKAAAVKHRNEWIAALENDYAFILKGNVLDGPLSGACVLACNSRDSSLRIYGYYVGDEFKIVSDAVMPISEVVSVEIIRPMEMKRVKKVQAVGVVSSSKKSPIARGLVGGAVLGPAGMILGAASGAGKDVKTEIKEHTVWEEAQMEGDPQLHIGTSDPSNPLIRIKPDEKSEADEWYHRIKAIQAQHSSETSNRAGIAS